MGDKTFHIRQVQLSMITIEISNLRGKMKEKQSRMRGKQCETREKLRDGRRSKEIQGRSREH